MKILLVDQIGHKTYEYDYAAARNYSEEYEVTCFMSDNTPKNIDTNGFHVVYGFHDVYSGNKILKAFKYMKALSELKKYIGQNSFDIINLQWYELSVYQKFFIKSIKRMCEPKPKIVMTVHGIMPWSKGIFRHLGLQLLYKEADAILLHSEPGLKHFNECFKTKCPKYVITSAFRDESEYEPIPKSDARKRLGIPLGKKVLLSFGTIRDDKTIDLLYKAFPLALERNDNLYLLSAGTLNVKKKKEYIALAKKCRDTGAAKIDFKYIPKEMEPVYYSAADILILPYSYISQSGVAYCGLLFHLPMIASRIPRLDLMAKEGINADLFESGNAEELANRIVELAASDEKLEKYSEGSKMILDRDFSIKRRVQITEKAYKSLYEK